MKLIDFVENVWSTQHSGVPFRRTPALEYACEIAEIAVANPDAAGSLQRYDLSRVASEMRRHVGNRVDQFIIDDPHRSEP